MKPQARWLLPKEVHEIPNIGHPPRSEKQAGCSCLDGQSAFDVKAPRYADFKAKSLCNFGVIGAGIHPFSEDKLGRLDGDESPVMLIKST